MKSVTATNPMILPREIATRKVCMLLPLRGVAAGVSGHGVREHGSSLHVLRATCFVWRDCFHDSRDASCVCDWCAILMALALLPSRDVRDFRCAQMLLRIVLATPRRGWCCVLKTSAEVTCQGPVCSPGDRFAAAALFQTP